MNQLGERRRMGSESCSYWGTSGHRFGCTWHTGYKAHEDCVMVCACGLRRRNGSIIERLSMGELRRRRS